MEIHHSRTATRASADGELLTLDEQDRSLWDAGRIAEGVRLVERALRLRRPGPYQLQAAISAVHAEAASAAETDWRQIAALYTELGAALAHARRTAQSGGGDRHGRRTPGWARPASGARG